MFSQPQGWFGLREPSRAFSAIVCKDGSTVWAEDASGKTIASGESGVDDASVIQSAITNNYGGTVYIKGDFTIKQTITIENHIRMFIDGTLKSDGVSKIISVRTVHTSPYGYRGVYIARGYIDGNEKEADGIEITDSYDVNLEDLVVRNCNIGIHLINENYWTESFRLKGRVEMCNYGIKSETKGSYVSMSQARVSADIEKCGCGFYVGSSFYRSFIDLMIWIPPNAVGMEIADKGNFWKAFVLARFEGDNTATAIKITNTETQYREYVPVLHCYFSLGIGAEVDNQTGWDVVIKRMDGIPWLEHIGTFTPAREMILLKSDGNEVFSVNRQGKIRMKHPILPTSQPSSPEAGSMYFDSSTGTLYIYDGSTWKSVSLT